MNSFNRLLSSYIDLFLIEKILYNYNRKKCSNFCVFKKKCVHLCKSKKQSKNSIVLFKENTNY